ncbi:MAG: coniferyl aldehyde dehydrogenase [Pseudomonadales bacterium]|nr:coniferyl aldehyde dehydrogenase [Pseudomonadales bacterium]
MNAIEKEPTEAVKLSAILKAQREAYQKDPVPSLKQRIQSLKALKQSLLTHHDRICAALTQDFGTRHSTESELIEFMPTITNINYIIPRLKKWMRADKRDSGMLLATADVKVIHQPLGVIGIIGTWNAPLMVTLGPLVYALAAGNRAMIKLSELNPGTNAAIRAMLADAFTEEEVAVIEGESDVSAAFAALPFDHIIFTGSTEVGRKILAAAAPNLTPVTLELGGKSPVVIGNDIDIEDAITRLIFQKCINSGQICLAPDYIFCPDGKIQEFIDTYCKLFKKMYGTAESSEDHSSIINDKHFQRLQTWLQDAKDKGAKVTSADDAAPNANKRKMATHLLTNVSDEMTVMQEEIFGPILPIKPYKYLQEVLDYINARPRPLGLYIMSHNKDFQHKILEHTHSGGVCINDSAFQATCDDAPFGGVGNSGMGHYHGKEGFMTFSKAKTVLTQGRFYPGKFTLPPYDKSPIKFVLKLLLR